MRGNYRYLFLDRSVKYVMILAVFLLIAESIGLIISYQFLPPLIPLFNSLPWGDARLAQREYIFAVPISILIILIMNVYISSISLNKRILLSRILSFNILLSVILSGIALVQIFILVF